MNLGMSNAFRIADTFTDSLSKLTNEEQKAVKTTAFDLQVNPASPGMKFHKLEKAKAWLKENGQLLEQEI